MNTIDDLRRTLRSHALDTDHEGHARAAAVTGRVHAVRRRRAVVGAVTLALVLVGGFVAVGALPSGQDEPEPAHPDAPTVLRGVDVPPTMTYQGYTFDYLAGGESREDASVVAMSVPEHDRPLVVAWVADDRTTVRVDELNAARGPAGDFATPRLLQDTVGDGMAEPGDLLTAEAAGGVGVAIYELSTTPPPGLSGAGAIFRQEVGDPSGTRTLIAAVVSEEGAGEVATRLVVPERPYFADFCWSDLSYSAADRAVPTPSAVMYVDDRWLVEGGTGCRGGGPNGSLTGADVGRVANPDSRPELPGLTVTRYREDGTPVHRTIAPGERVTVSIRLQDRDFQDYRGEVPGVRFGVGVYAGS